MNLDPPWALLQAAGFTAAICMVDPISIAAAAGLTIFKSGWPPVATFFMAYPPTGKKGVGHASPSSCLNGIADKAASPLSSAHQPMCHVF